MNHDTSSLGMIGYEQWLALRVSLRSCYIGRIGGPREVLQEPLGLSAWLVTRGWVEAVPAESAAEPLRAGVGYWLLPPNCLRWQRFSDDCELLSLNFYTHWPSGQPLLDWADGLILEADRHPRLRWRAELLNRAIEWRLPGHTYGMFKRSVDLATFVRLQALFPKWLTDLVEALRQYGIYPSISEMLDSRVIEATGLLEKHPLDKPLDAGELAARTGLSVRQLDRLLVKQTGTTLHGYLQRRRLERARQLLELRDVSIKQIALSLGFRVQAHFTRWFKRLDGRTPRDCRRGRRR